MLNEKPPLALARCHFHVGEAARQGGKLTTARAHLDEAAIALARVRADGEHEARQAYSAT